MIRHLITCCLLLTFTPALQALQYQSKLLIEPDSVLDESAEMSLDELQKSFSQLQDAYAKSSAGTRLAHEFVQQKQYDKAVQYYEAALQANGLADAVNRQLRTELASVYLLMNNPAQSFATLQQAGSLNTFNDINTILLYAQAAFKSNHYPATADALQRAALVQAQPDTVQFRQMLALAWGIADYPRCEQLLQAWLASAPDTDELWFQLAAVQLKQDKKNDALAVLNLALQRGIRFAPSQYLLLCDVSAQQGNPARAAQLLEQAMTDGVLEKSAEVYQRLFDYWRRARESGKALAALEQAATLGNDIELYLYWAQLLMDKQQWQAMNDVMERACKNPVPVNRLGQANLLSGISLLKTGKRSAAENAFMAATAVGGVNEQAGQWLAFMGADIKPGTVSSPGKSRCRPATP